VGDSDKNKFDYGIVSRSSSSSSSYLFSETRKKHKQLKPIKYTTYGNLPAKHKTHCAGTATLITCFQIIFLLLELFVLR